jgi:16S rRNA (cytosine1402-N4)-methyltransferase
MKGKSDDGTGLLVTKKPFIPSDSEILQNRRSRSAKLRVIEKIF